MADVARRTHVRNDRGPRPVESRHRRRTSTATSNTTSTTHRRQPSASTSNATSTSSTQYALNLLKPPPTHLYPSQPFTPAVLVTTPYLSSNTGSSTLLSVISLLRESQPNTFVPVPATYFSVPGDGRSHLVDSVDPLPSTMMRDIPREKREGVVGFSEFCDLAVKEEGAYRIRVSLVRVGVDGRQEVVGGVDSGVVRVGKWR